MSSEDRGLRSLRAQLSELFTRSRDTRKKFFTASSVWLSADNPAFDTGTEETTFAIIMR